MVIWICVCPETQACKLIHCNTLWSAILTEVWTGCSVISHSVRGVGQGSGGQGKSGLMWKLQDGKGFVSFLTTVLLFLKYCRAHNRCLVNVFEINRTWLGINWVIDRVNNRWQKQSCERICSVSRTSRWDRGTHLTNWWKSVTQP